MFIRPFVSHVLALVSRGYHFFTALTILALSHSLCWLAKYFPSFYPIVVYLAVCFGNSLHSFSSLAASPKPSSRTEVSASTCSLSLLPSLSPNYFPLAFMAVSLHKRRTPDRYANRPVHLRVLQLTLSSPGSSGCN
ncbi:unnamed protein product [Protopolystoma xenopodis]|uniref:Uncharacterized protein n=1 Tax=Protopolystoma xenopodis TaxID=117903 RepID=A0A3S5A9N8_9PLAT|nr:unnamed protein product [Protopolystoma xenopodis]